MNHLSDFSNFLGHTNQHWECRLQSAHLVEIQLQHLKCETVQATYLCCEVFVYLNVASTVTTATWLSNYASSVTHSLATSEEAP